MKALMHSPPERVTMTAKMARRILLMMAMTGQSLQMSTACALPRLVTPKIWQEMLPGASLR